VIATVTRAALGATLAPCDRMNSINAQQPEDNHENLIGKDALCRARATAI
jgi:hypothetical protein